ncbi:hypothetical protein IW147_003181 [Coemansia sp. RSA 720]|nr:hypothetical protein IW147_003181 [Coemansia sp. RSA 720]
MNATDMMQSLSPSASPSMSPLVRFRHSCEHCSGTRPTCDHCLRRSIPCEYKPQAKTPRRPRGSSPSAYSKRSSRVQPISIPAVNMFLPLQMANAHSAPNAVSPNPSMQLRPASAIPPRLSNSSSFSTMLSPNSPLAFGYSSDTSTPSMNGFGSNTSTPVWNGLGFENTPEISINGLLPESDPALYSVHSQPQTAPAGSSTFDSASFAAGFADTQLEPTHRRSMTDESANSASNVPLIERSANVDGSADPSLFGLYAHDQQMSYSMPSFPATAMSASNELQFFKPDESAYMNLVDSYAMSPQQSYSMQPYSMQPYPMQSYPTQPYPTQPYPTQPYPTQAYPTPVPAKQKSSLGIAPELTVCQDSADPVLRKVP